METLARRQFVEKLQNSALRCRESQRPIPLTPGLDGKAGMKRIVADALARLQIPGKACKAARDRLAAEELPVIVKDELRIKRQLVEPAWGRLPAVEMHGCRSVREVMGIALQFERRSAAHDDWIFEQGLKRDHNLLPA